MDPVIASLLGTVIGGLFGIAGGLLTGRRQAALEREKWFQARKDEIERETRLAVADLTRKLAAASQAMRWLISKAVNAPEKLSPDDISAYDEEIQKLLPDILGSLMAISAVDKGMSEKLLTLVNRIYEVDLEIALASREFGTSREASVTALRKASRAVIRLRDELHQSISDVTGLANLSNNGGVLPDR